MSDQEPTLLELVKEAHENAAENDCDISTMTPEEAAADMLECGGIPEDYSVDEIAVAIIEYRASK